MAVAARSAAAGRPRRRSRARGAGRSLTHPPRTGLALIAPALAFVLVFVAVPLGLAIYISLTNWPLIGRYEFVGLANYEAIPQDSAFLHSILYTLVYTALVTGPILVVGYGMAVLVRSNRRGAGLFRTACFLPYVTGLTTLSFFAVLECQPGTGALDWLLGTLHLSDGSTAWLVNTVPATAVICVLVVWAASGLTMVLLLAGMQAIPRELYESAELDGASWWAMERRITLPLLRRTIALSLILSVVGSLLAFNQFLILTQGGPGVSTTTVVLWIYNQAFVNLHLGFATSLSIVLVIAVGVISATQFLLLRQEDES